MQISGGIKKFLLITHDVCPLYKYTQCIWNEADTSYMARR
jgi:hypothetical protein